MSARIPPGFGEIWWQLRATGDNEDMYTAVGIDITSGETVGAAQVNAAQEEFLANFDTVISSTYTLGPGHIIVGQDGGDLRIDGTSPFDAFIGASTAVPQNTAYLVHKVTATGGRRGRGRMYIPGVTEADVSSVGALSAGALTNLTAALTALLSGLVAMTWIDALVLLHDSAPFTPTPITGLTASPMVATQRRRLRR